MTLVATNETSAITAKDVRAGRPQTGPTTAVKMRRRATGRDATVTWVSMPRDEHEE